jgi:hypothetical protein
MRNFFKAKSWGLVFSKTPLNSLRECPRDSDAGTFYRPLVTRYF